MAARRPETPEHRAYEGSPEEEANIPAQPDQKWTATEVNDFRATHINHADLLDRAELKWYVGYTLSHTWIVDENGRKEAYHAHADATTVQIANVAPGTNADVWVLDLPVAPLSSNPDLNDADIGANTEATNTLSARITEYVGAINESIADLSQLSGSQNSTLNTALNAAQSRLTAVESGKASQTDVAALQTSLAEVESEILLLNTLTDADDALFDTAQERLTELKRLAGLIGSLSIDNVAGLRQELDSVTSAERGEGTLQEMLTSTNKKVWIQIVNGVPVAVWDKIAGSPDWFKRDASNTLATLVNGETVLMTMSQGVAYAGGTFQCSNTSPDGLLYVRGSDVGGTRVLRQGQAQWECLSTTDDDADRKVAGVLITDADEIYSLVGNAATSGRIIKHDADRNVSVIYDGLHVYANKMSDGDTDARPRPVGWMLWLDSTANIIYACTGDGLFRCPLDNPSSGSIIALSGESLRGFVHDDAITIGSVTDLTVCTRTQGIVRVNTVQGTATTTQLGAPTRAEDGAFTSGGNIIAACQRQGISRIEPNGTTTDITPSQAPIGAFGAADTGTDLVSWSTVDVHPVTNIAIVAMINPVNAAGWMYRTTVSADTATASDWEPITSNQVTLHAGVGFVQPKVRTIGGAADSGGGLTGINQCHFDRNDATGNTVHATATLVTAKSTNAAATDPATVAWDANDRGSSLLSMLDLAISDAGVLVIATSDHNSMTAPSLTSAVNNEVTREGVSGLGDAYAVAVVGQTWVFAPVDDADWQDPDNKLMYFTGSGEPSAWSSVGWESYDWNTALTAASLTTLPAGVVAPRPVSVCGHDNGDGTITYHIMADGVGAVKQTYTVSTDAWGDPEILVGGPTGADVISEDQNTSRASRCKDDGTVVLHQFQKTGHIYRLTGGVFARIASGTNGPEIAATPRYRSGYMRIDDAGDYAVVSNKNGTYVIKNLTATDPQVVLLSTLNGPIAIDQATGRTYIHIHSSGPIQLLQFDDIENATDFSTAVDIANDEYSKHLGYQANQLEYHNDNGTGKLITVYQGGGFVVSELTDD